MLACAETEPDGLPRSASSMAAATGVTTETVSKWRGRFLKDRLEGLGDAPRPGRERTVTDEQVVELVRLTLEARPKNATHWSTRSMAQQVGLSQSTVSRVWRAFGLQPHRAKSFKLSTDPFFVDKVHDVVGLYLKWLLARPRFQLHFTPTGSSWLNLVERGFAELTNKKLRRGTHRCVHALERDIRAWIAGWNDNPRPYVWTKTADQIPESLSTYRRRIKDSGH